MEYQEPFFLGQATVEPDQFSPKHQVRFNANGFDQPRTIRDRKIKKWQKKGMPDSVLDQLRSWPPKPIGELIDEAIDSTRALFSACGGDLSRRALAIDPRTIKVVIEPAPFLHPQAQQYAAGIYDPNNNQIHSVALYYQFAEQWLRRAQEVLTWEWCNAFAVMCGIAPYPRVEGWPCTAKRV